MKKVIVLVLAAALSSAASGVTSTLIVETDSEAYTVGEVAVVTIVTGPEFSGMMGSWLANIDFDVTVAETTTDVSASVGTLIASMQMGLGWSNGKPGTKPILIDDVAGRSVMSDGVQGGVTIYTFELDVGANAGLVTIGLADIVGTNPFNMEHTITGASKEIYVGIPEPMTAVLVGVGGLLLRRRRQAVRRTRALF